MQVFPTSTVYRYNIMVQGHQLVPPVVHKAFEKNTSFENSPFERPNSSPLVRRRTQGAINDHCRRYASLKQMPAGQLQTIE
jgi:hypothetical protein